MAVRLFHNTSGVTRQANISKIWAPQMKLDLGYVIEHRSDNVDIGTKRLAAQVLIDATKCYFSAGRQKIEVRDWVADNESFAPFSFLFVCEVLGLRHVGMRGTIAGFMQLVDEHKVSKRQVVSMMREILSKAGEKNDL